MNEPCVTFIAQSKYSGKCAVFNCANRWRAGQQCYWSQRTRQVFCIEHGEDLLSQQEAEGKAIDR